MSGGDPIDGALVDQVLARTEAIARIPAPTGAEADRAAAVAAWWREDGWGEVRIDDAGNIWAMARPGEGRSIVLCAHLDTVFGADVPLDVGRDGTRLLGPGVGDDGVALAALSAVARLLEGSAGAPVRLVATTGEEGLGNLRGIRAALEAQPGEVGTMIAVEGNYLGRVSPIGVGSFRWRVSVSGPGGHAWERAEAPSAVHAVARIATGLATLHHDGALSSVNVGRIGGGEAVNARARAAWLEVDIRADDTVALAALERQARTVASADEGLSVRVEEIGRRPAGRLDLSHPLVVAATAALEEIGLGADIVATSTDANAAHELGIPAIAVGVTTGGGEHTPEEWIDTEPIGDGLRALAATVRRLDEAPR